MGCVVNAIGEAKSADVAIAFGKGSGLVMKKGRNNSQTKWRCFNKQVR